jgi:hypothetical protein
MLLERSCRRQRTKIRRTKMVTMILPAATMRRRSQAMREANTPLRKRALKVQLTSQMMQWPLTIHRTK